MPFDRNDLESKCRELLKDSNQTDFFELPRILIEREMALTLDQLGRTRRRTKSILDDLYYADLGPANRLLNLKRLPTEYSHDLWVQRDKVRNQLTNIRTRLQSQKVKVITDYEREVQSLEVKLLHLMNKHEHLRLDDGDS